MRKPQVRHKVNGRKAAAVEKQQRLLARSQWHATASSSAGDIQAPRFKLGLPHVDQIGARQFRAAMPVFQCSHGR